MFFAFVAVVCAEPPSYSYLPPSTYGAPIESHHTSTHYEQRPVGHSGSEGLHVDHNLLSKIKHVLIAHENSGSSGGHGHGGHEISTSYGAPQSTYGVPQSTYGVPRAHYRTTDLHFGDVWQSNAVAYYVGKESGGHGGYGYSAPAPAPVWISSKPSISYGVPKSTYGAPRPSKPISITYGAPQW